ncbi:MAG: DsbA family protein [Acidimicrobiia bacterium]|nr:DsbA family protein [Acidimicrobiia bacterium]
MRLGLLLFAGAALFAACGDDAGSGYEPITVIVDDSQSSPFPEGFVPNATTGTDEQPAFSPLDLSALGDNASASAVPSAIPGGLEVGFTEEGYPYRGNADAKVTLIEYSDYACPFCGRYNGVSLPELLTQYGTSGDVRFIFREFPLTGLHPTAPTAHVAAYCLGEQSPELYWAMHDAIFAGQADWTGLPDPAEVLRTMAEGLGADMTSFEECATSGRGEAVVDAGVADAQALGFNGTPSFEIMGDGVEGIFNIIGAQAVGFFQTYIDALIAGEAPADPEPEPGEEPDTSLPVWADTATGLRPDPDRPGVNMAGDHYKGNPDAAVVVIEFSDFQCPFCREHAVDVQPTIDEQFIETGQILWVYKHLPLAIHPLAPAAGAAAECAGDQGQFFEMHELLFASVDRWAEGDIDAEMVALAGELGLDSSVFEACYNGRDALERVLSDLTDARGIVSQTPSFVVIIGDRGSLMEGSLPVDQFVATLTARLEQAAEAAAGGGDSGG